MGIAYVKRAADEVRSLIAQILLGNSDDARRMGEVLLAPHQADAVSRIREALREFRGALLCDAVGSGKTYIGLAVAHEMRKPVIIAPAALRTMWNDAIAKTDSDARFVTLESLSYGKVDLAAHDGLIVDEAHHFRNAATKRYRELSRSIAGRPMLLMTATPIHNSERDFANLAALFLGARARCLSPVEVTRLVIRREQAHVQARMPEVASTVWLSVGDDAATAADLLALPPPVPPREAGEANALATLGLVRQWASSDAALAAALQRRRTRAAGLESALESGEHPSSNELKSWIAGDDAVQLAFGLGSETVSELEPTALLGAVRVHSIALDEVFKRLGDHRPLDDVRAELLTRIRAAHPSARIVAFASYEATVRALFDRLLRLDRVACLASNGAYVAGGRVARADVIRQFDPASPPAKDSERIDLLLATDLLSEGVNLQNASVVVHLDVPWTAARLEQRVGRVARIGCTSQKITVFGFKPPASAECILRAQALVTSKWLAAAATVGAQRDPGLSIPPARPRRSTPEFAESLRRLLSKWRRHRVQGDSAAVAAVSAEGSARFVALIESGSSAFLLSGAREISDDPEDLLDAATSACGPDAAVGADAYESVFTEIEDWIVAKRAATAAGIDEGKFLRTRRDIFARIGALATSTSPHARFTQAHVIEDARRAAAKTLGAGDEQAMKRAASLHDPGDPAEWFTSLARTAHSPSRNPPPDQTYRIRAVLLLVPATRPRAS